MLSENIKALRKKKGYSQETLAQQLFVVRQTVSKWEKGLSVPDAEMLEKLAEVLEVSVNELLDKPAEQPQPDNSKEIARQLAILNDQLANQSRRRKKILKTILMIFIALFVIPPIILFALFSLFRMSGSSAENDTVYVIEDDEGISE